jgi:predicted aldo/keto reductase-like oxidoreductase
MACGLLYCFYAIDEKVGNNYERGGLKMQYRKFGKLDWQASALGFGCMRLPTAEGDPNSANINEKEALRIIHHAIDNGLNYLDSAYRYHSGQSEIVLGKALKGGYRDKVRVATKCPMPMVKTAEDYTKLLDEQLTKLDVDYLDFYLFHGLGKSTWDLVVEQDILSKAEAAQKAGKIRYIGFSFHDSYEVFEQIVTGYDKWDMCQIQYNIIDEETQAGRKGVELAASRGLGVVVMEPLRGGKLGTPIKEVSALMKEAGYQGTMADLAFRWLWNQPEVTVALSGMTTMEQVQENLQSAQNAQPNALSEKEMQLIKEIRAAYGARTGIPCTSCGYCLPCPQSIPIPRTLGFYNEGLIYDYYEESKRVYAIFGGNADKCVQCKECEAKCPQSIPISEWMTKINEAFSAK